MAKTILSAAAALALSACATATVEETPADFVPEGFERTGETKACLRQFPQRQITPVAKGVLLVREGVDTYYLNRTSGDCSRADSPGYFLRLNIQGGVGLCRGEIVDVVDNQLGFVSGSCALGEFERLEKVDADEEETASAETGDADAEN